MASNIEGERICRFVENEEGMWLHRHDKDGAFEIVFLGCCNPGEIDEAMVAHLAAKDFGE